MNIGYLIELIKADPTILDDVPSFISNMNEKNITVITKTRTDFIEEVDVVSLAERNGGELTQEDIDYALKLIAQEPLKQAVDDKFKIVFDAVSDGEILDIDAIDAKLKEVAEKKVTNTK